MAKDADLTDRTRGTLVAQLLDGPNTVAILDGYASITPLRPDLTDYDALDLVASLARDARLVPSS